MQVIPLVAVPSQTLTVQLAGQACRINLKTRTTGLYMDVLVNDDVVLSGVLCRDATFVIRDAYFGFIGDLAFFDLLGASDPVYTGLGSRWFLVYTAPGELVFDVVASIPPFAPWTYVLGTGVAGGFISYDGVNPISA